MYIQITTRCNMRCAHCCYSCTEKGQDMSMDTVKAAFQLAADSGDTISIGGGEPTLHPNFWEIIGLALGYQPEENFVWMATNGSQTEIALRLANLAKTGVMGVALSQDWYHAAIDQRVVKAFTRDNSYSHRDNDCREIRNVTKNVIATGRARNLVAGKKGCVCEDTFVTPSGDIKVCGCKKAPVIGNVFNPESYWEWKNTHEVDGCYKTVKNIEE